MPVKAVVGMQWGDEGKGKIVDVLSAEADLVVRAAGGSNAGHTIIRGGKKTVLHLVPSGILHEYSRCLLGAGMVIEPSKLREELDVLEQFGTPRVGQRVGVDPQAMLILPWHKAIEHVREARPDALGTTLRGIGPAYESRASRLGIPLALLAHPELLKTALEALYLDYQPIFELGNEPVISPSELLADLMQVAGWLVPMFTDVSLETARASAEGRFVLLEGAQGVMLDSLHGTYPFVTSSSTVFGGLLSGIGLGNGMVSDVVGVCKAYATRVGNGPFPTELEDETGKHLAAFGGEYGATTGRLRRCGWLDAVALKKAVRLVGSSQLALTKVDVLCDLPEIKVAVAYEDTDGAVLADFPCDPYRAARMKPVYRSFAPWRAPSDDAILPDELQEYISFLEGFTATRVSLVSWGPDRSQTLVRDAGGVCRSLNP
ncbi:adenylosuccinate synthase [Myxococcota bacterium]|nr:adenylosuccinate synthase [Myxococcota bacterium]MBU1411367.1 adenylosuccinate synthase [Myxococcota bacterium]